MKKQKHSAYLLKYYIEGINRESQPANMSRTMEQVKESLNWDPEDPDGNSFVNIASQVNRNVDEGC